MTLSFRGIRIAILLLILFIVSAETWLGIIRTTDWDAPLWVTIYPINGDNSLASKGAIERLRASDFEQIVNFLQRETKRYGVDIDQPVTIDISSEVKQRPPETPSQYDNPLLIALWSLKMRWWVWKADNYTGPSPDIRIFIEYFDSEESHGHTSFGLQKGRYGVARLYASSKHKSRNNIVIAHELLHTLGASDKYDLVTLQPHYPDGFSQPTKQPRYPQSSAEIMAGRIPISPYQVEMPFSLSQVIVGPKTASEIGWTE